MSRLRSWRRITWMWAAAGLGLLAATTVQADLVHLNDGAVLQGRLEPRDGGWVLETIDGALRVEADEIRQVQRQQAARLAFGGRLAAVLDDADACVDLALWAFNHRLDQETVWALRAALLARRDHERAQSLLFRYRRRADDLPINVEATGKLLADLGPDFQLLRTSHFRIAYNATDAFARHCAALLERVYEEFVAFFDDRYFVPAPLTDRLEVVLFDGPEPFRSHVGWIVGAGVENSGGFYASSTGRSYFYDALALSSLAEQRQRIRDAQADVDHWQQKVRRDRDVLSYRVTEADGVEHHFNRADMLKELRRRELDLQRQMRELDQRYDEQNLSVAVHESVHHLAYAAGIHSAFFRTPMWVTEGLALYFEAPTDGIWRGPGQVNRERLRSFCKQGQGEPFLRLDELITNDDLFNLAGARSEMAYAAAWGLFYCLAQRRHEAFFDYLFELSLKVSDRPYEAAERRADFERHFGAIDRVERQWWTFVLGLSDS